MPKRNRTPKQTITPHKSLDAICNRDLTFQECEIAILRHAVDKSEKFRGEKLAQSEEIIQIMDEVEDFIRKRKLVCYGGTAINNILPKYDQFYDRTVDIPDYDFFSVNALDDAKALADLFYTKGYNEVEAKAGVHKGTYKVFVNFIPVADITYLHPTLFASISKEAIKIDGIKYAPPNYLRMAMYLELSRPHGDVSRWEKVLKRINLLNKHYPLEEEHKGDCDDVEYQRKMEHNAQKETNLFNWVREVFINEGCVFFGGYAASLYSNYLGKSVRRKLRQIPDFDVLAEDPEQVALLAKEQLETHGIKSVKVFRHNPLGEVVPEHYELVVGEDTVAFIYRPISCHSYNIVSVDGKRINVATIDTLLSFYLAFLYADKHYYDKTRILCMSAMLFEVQQHNRLKQSGILKRFSLKCFGKQDTLDAIRAKKARMFVKLKKGSAEYEEWFLKYNPANNPKIRRKVSPPTATETAEETEEKNTYEVVDSPHSKTAQHLPKTRKQKPAVADTTQSLTPTPTPSPKSKKTRKAKQWGKKRSGFLY